MWLDVLKWVSIVLSWFALGLNVWGFVRSNRMFEKYREKYLELLKKEVTNEKH